MKFEIAVHIKSLLSVTQTLWFAKYYGLVEIKHLSKSQTKMWNSLLDKGIKATEWEKKQTSNKWHWTAIATQTG